MKPQRYARQDPYPDVPFSVVRRLAGRRRSHLIEEVLIGIVAGVAIAYAFAEYLA